RERVEHDAAGRCDQAHEPAHEAERLHGRMCDAVYDGALALRGLRLVSKRREELRGVTELGGLSVVKHDVRRPSAAGRTAHLPVAAGTGPEAGHTVSLHAVDRLRN